MINSNDKVKIMMKRRQEGFTLIELMIVVAIIGILAAVAIPAYQDYIKKSKVTEANTLFDGFKTEIMNIYSDKGTYPSWAELIAGGIVWKGTYVEAQESQYKPDPPTICFVVKGFPTGQDSIGWSYQKYDGTNNSWGCHNSASTSANKRVSGCTTVEEKYLPKPCKE